MLQALDNDLTVNYKHHHLKMKNGKIYKVLLTDILRVSYAPKPAYQFY